MFAVLLLLFVAHLMYFSMGMMVVALANAASMKTQKKALSCDTKLLCLYLWPAITLLSTIVFVRLFFKNSRSKK